MQIDSNPSSPATPPAQSGHPKSALVSFLLGIFSTALVGFVFQYPVMFPPPGEALLFQKYMQTLGALAILLLAGSLIGFILGIVALTRRDAKKGLAVIGLVLNLLVFIVSGFFLAFGLGSMFRA